MDSRAAQPSPEQPILRARARAKVSADGAFEQLYALYGATVLAWLAARVEAPTAQDLAQDVWTIFYSRWQRWQFTPEMEAPGARPVLSFLYRTGHFVLRGWQKRQVCRAHSELTEAEEKRAAQSPESLTRNLQYRQALEKARATCPAEELDVLLARLSGLSLQESASSLGITTAVVDHRFRMAIARLRDALQISPAQKGGKHA